MTLSLTPSPPSQSPVNAPGAAILGQAPPPSGPGSALFTDLLAMVLSSLGSVPSNGTDVPATAVSPGDGATIPTPLNTMAQGDNMPQGISAPVIPPLSLIDQAASDVAMGTMNPASGALARDDSGDAPGPLGSAPTPRVPLSAMGAYRGPESKAEDVAATAASHPLPLPKEEGGAADPEPSRAEDQRGLSLFPAMPGLQPVAAPVPPATPASPQPGHDTSSAPTAAETLTAGLRPAVIPSQVSPGRTGTRSADSERPGPLPAEDEPKAGARIAPALGDAATPMLVGLAALASAGGTKGDDGQSQANAAPDSGKAPADEAALVMRAVEKSTVSKSGRTAGTAPAVGSVTRGEATLVTEPVPDTSAESALVSRAPAEHGTGSNGPAGLPLPEGENSGVVLVKPALETGATGDQRHSIATPQISASLNGHQQAAVEGQGAASVDVELTDQSEETAVAKAALSSKEQGSPEVTLPSSYERFSGGVAEADAQPGTVRPGAAPDHQAVVNQIVRQSHMLSFPARSSLRLRLEPAALGQLDIRVEIDRDGALGVKLAAGSSQVKEIIEAGLPALRAALAQQGLRAERFSVVVAPGLNDFSFQRQGHHTPAPPNRWAVPGFAYDDARESLGMIPVAPKAAPSLVDCLA